MNMAKANGFETTHAEKLKNTEGAALDALKEILEGKSQQSAAVDAVRVQAATLALSVRAQDA